MRSPLSDMDASRPRAFELRSIHVTDSASTPSVPATDQRAQSHLNGDSLEDVDIIQPVAFPIGERAG